MNILKLAILLILLLGCTNSAEKDQKNIQIKSTNNISSFEKVDDLTLTYLDFTFSETKQGDGNPGTYVPPTNVGVGIDHPIPANVRIVNNINVTVLIRYNGQTRQLLNPGSTIDICNDTRTRLFTSNNISINLDDSSSPVTVNIRPNKICDK